MSDYTEIARRIIQGIPRYQLEYLLIQFTRMPHRVRYRHIKNIVIAGYPYTLSEKDLRKVVHEVFNIFKENKLL